MAKTRILIVDQDSSAVQAMREPLLANGFEVNVHAELTDMRVLTSAERPHALVLDAGAAGMMGFELLRELRKISPLPILLTSPSATVDDKIRGLEAGADDFLVKPFEPRELAARVQSLLRRAAGHGSQGLGFDVEAREWRFHGLTVQSNRRRVLLDSEAVELTTAEFDLLRLFVAHAQEILSRETILDQLRGIEWESVDRSIDILVSRLRDKLKDDPRKPRFVRTVRSVGYQFVGEPLTDETA